MRGRGTLRLAVMALPTLGAAFSLTGPRPEPRGVGAAEALLVTCKDHGKPVGATDGGWLCRAGPHYVCSGCGTDLGRTKAIMCASCVAEQP